MIRTEAVSLVYHDQDREVFACREVSLEIGENEFVGILGPSGSGKSSLLYLLSGLKEPTAGDVAFQGKSLSGLSDEERSALRLREFGFVFQQPCDGHPRSVDGRGRGPHFAHSRRPRLGHRPVGIFVSLGRLWPGLIKSKRALTGWGASGIVPMRHGLTVRRLGSANNLLL
ncbi:MAG: ATP-binding cassette domain-containing protein [Fimbriimonas ginsengisoli]|nr:ATP-binding cassette domain-containing protein [Fimbriimonas ginsengisoli]